MIMVDDKRAVSTIMKMRKSAQGEDTGAAPMKPEVVKKEDGTVDGRHIAASDVIRAINEKSPERLMRALANFHDLHSSHEETPTEE